MVTKTMVEAGDKEDTSAEEVEVVRCITAGAEITVLLTVTAAEMIEVTVVAVVEAVEEAEAVLATEVV
jgi:hypothetical protein